MAKIQIKKMQPADVLIGLILGIILTVVAIKFVVPHIGSSTSDNNSDSIAQGLATTIADAPYLGNKDKAKVAIVEFSDFECPYCQTFFNDTFDQIVKNYVDNNKVIFVYRNLPLAFHEPAATKEANAALCVKNLKDNSAYFEMARLIYNNSGLNGKGISNDDLIKFAKQAGADQSKFEECLNSNQYNETVQKDVDAAGQVGISGTPSFVVGKLGSDSTVKGETLIGAQPFSAFEEAINKYLK